MVLVREVVTVDQLKASVGKELARVVSPPISANDIRRFAIGVYWPETPPRLYWDEEYARQTRWGGIIAPQEFNPFAWPILGPSFLPSPTGVIAGGRPLNGGTEAQYAEPMRPGDTITATERITEVRERPSRAGTLILVFVESIWRNQRSELVKRMIGTHMHVLPEGKEL